MSSNWSFVVAAYAVTWVAIIGYYVHLHRAARRASRLLETGEARRARAAETRHEPAPGARGGGR